MNSASPPTTAKTTAGRPYIGGQAVIEGVMMRSPTSFAIVVRRKNGSLVVRERAVVDDRTGWRKWPFLRGIHSLVESLKLGSESLRFSIEHFEADLDAGVATKGATQTLLALATRIGLSLSLLATTPDDPPPPFPASDPIAATTGSPARERTAEEKKSPFGFMAIVAVLFLIALPQFAAEGLNRALHLGLDTQSPKFQMITGAMKLTVVVGYLLLIRRVADIRRVFQYHGAEHKTISTYEANEALSVANARQKTTLHPRCGTTFLVMVALVSILIFTALGAVLPKIETGNNWLNNLVFFLCKLPFLPLIAAVTFEIQRLFARYCTTGPLRALLWPGFLVQKITTIEPNDEQLEVALASLRVTLFREAGDASSSTGDVTFASFGELAQSAHLRAG